MLGKLFKYDMKIQMKILGMAYLIMGIIAGIAAIVEGIRRNFDDRLGILRIAGVVTTGLATAAMVAVFLGTIFYAVFFYRKNLLKDQGYLMHTLPVKTWQLYLSKWLSSTLCLFVSAIVILAGICLTFLRIPNVSDILDGMKASGMPMWYIALLLAIVIVSIPISLTQFYAALSFGYTIQTNTTTPVNKDLLSVISYIVIYMLQQVLSLGVMMITALAYVGKTSDIDELLKSGGMESMKTMVDITGGMYVIVLIVCVVIGIVTSVLSVWRMKKHLNLN